MLKKGEAPPAYYAGKLEPYNFRNISKERMKEMSRKSAETRRKKREEKMFLQKCMKSMLSLKVSSPKQKQILRSMGISDEDLQNKTLLMASLFMKGVKGDVQAIKEIVDMMDRLDILEDTGNVTQGININLVSVGNDEDKNKRQDDEDVWDEDEWGEDVYEP